MFRNFEELGKKLEGKERTVVVAAAEDAHAVEGVSLFVKDFKAKVVLVGNGGKIAPLCEMFGLADYELVETKSDEESAAVAVGLVRDGKADALMKGALNTAVLLKAVLNKETGINVGGLMSHLAAVESPKYHKLMYITDGGITPYPTLEQKTAILKNSVDYLEKLGYEHSKVALLAAAETVSEKMPETLDAQTIAANNNLPNCTVEGPLSFDLAISRESAEIKNFTSKISGEVDIFIAPNIATGNIMTKSLLYLGNAKMAGCVLGAKVPIILTSRGATAEEKFLSFLFALV